MGKQQLQVTVASEGKLIAKSLFNNYDVCLNTYVGCQFGCTYCYVAFLHLDDAAAKKEGRAILPWGDFVRVRAHVADQLPKELNKGLFRLAMGKEPMLDQQGLPILNDSGKPKQRTLYSELPVCQARLVLGTLTDPYQPAERKNRITRTALEIIAGHRNQFNKVGIFTRSPLVLEDLDLIGRLPRARIHFTVTPFPPEVLRQIEPISPRTDRRWEVLRRIKESGIRMHVNVSPVIPLLSDEFVDEFAQRLAELEPAESFIDPFQPYREAMDSFRAAMVGDERWSSIEHTLNNREAYDAWKAEYKASWERAWARYGAGKRTLLIWSDHQFKVWTNLATGAQMDQRLYGDDL